MLEHLAARFWEQVERGGSDDCWLHTGTPGQDGYKVMWFGAPMRKYWGVHRFAYFVTHGSIPDRHDIHHTCHTKMCCNPRHLVAKTKAEHILEPGHMAGKYAGRTHCARGHELTPENIQRRGSRKQCRQCIRESRLRRLEAKRGTPAVARINGRKTHCKHGHAFTPENTAFTATGAQRCQTCGRTRMRESRARHKAAKAV